MEDQTEEQFEQDLLKMLHTARNGWRSKQITVDDLKAIRSDSHQQFQEYSKQIQVIKKVLTPLLRAHAWHWIRYTEADKRIAEREKLQRVSVQKGGRGRRELTPEELIRMMTPEQLREFIESQET